jgi:hypothetical protein
MYKRCINGKVDGVSENKIYEIIDTKMYHGTYYYGINDDYGIYNEFKSDRFIDVKPYAFELWYCLDLHKNKELHEQAKDLINSIGKEGLEYIITNDGILKLKLTIFEISDLIQLGEDLGNDIVIYGVDSDILMTKNTMNQLGLS